MKQREIISVPLNVSAIKEPVLVPALQKRGHNDRGKQSSELEQMRRRSPQDQVQKIQPIRLGDRSGVLPGVEVIATLISGGANGLIKAKLPDGLRSSGELIFEPGTVLLGTGSSSDERLFIQFTKAISPDQSQLKIKGLAYDMGDRILGVKGKKISDYAFKLAASSGLIFLSGLADGMREESGSASIERRRPTVKDAALNGVATSASELGKSTIQRMNSSQARIEVGHSTKVLVIFNDFSSND
ncbi:MAG: TrbI/VirB10 family protein [Bdellovibrionota bacterium]